MGFQTCGPNEVMVVSGCCHSQPSYIPGGCVFVWPFIQKLQRLSLNTMTLTIETPLVYTKQSVPVSVTSIAQVKVHSGHEKLLQTACELFLGKSEMEISKVAKEILEGHQGTILGSMTVEEICKDRKKFSNLVFEVASSDLINLGLHVVSFTIKDIRDESEAVAREKLMQARYASDIEIAKSQRDFEIKKIEGFIGVQTKKAQADYAYELQMAKTQQKISEEIMQVEVIERAQQTQVQEQEVIRKERELVAQISKPAEAEKFQLETLAEAYRVETVLLAEAQAVSIRMMGEAEAYVIEACAVAETGQMVKKADAWREYQDAAMINMILETLPKIAAEVSAPLTNTRKVTMVSNGQAEVGALRLTSELMNIMEKLPVLVENLTGKSIINVGSKL